MKNKLQKIFKEPRIVIVAAPLILLSPIYLTGKAFFWGTPGTQFVPWWDFAWSSILAGEAPFWNPLLGMGSPLIANYQTALFYPPTWIYFLSYWMGGVKLMAWMISILVCGHLIWAGLGTAELLRELGANRLGQTTAGLAFGLSGYLVARAGFLSINAAAAWIPWLLVMILRLAKKRPGSLLRLVAVLAMLLLAGHAQTAFYGIFLGGIWGVYGSLFNAAPGKKIGNLGRTLGGYLAAGLWAAGIAAIQLIPTGQYLLLSQRAAEYGFEQAMTYSFWPWRFLTLVMPDLFGNPAAGNYWGYGNFWEDAVYIGLLPLLLAVGFIFRSIRKKTRAEIKAGVGMPGLGLFLGGITLIAFVLALGKNTPIFPFFYRTVPGADLFQAPTRHTIAAEISLAILAGLGAHYITKPAGKRLYLTRLAVAGCAAIILGTLLTSALIDDLKVSFLHAAAWAGVLGLLAAILILILPEDKAQAGQQLWNWAVVLLIGVDLISAGWGLNPGIDPSFYQVESQTMQEGRIWMPADIEYDLKFKRFLRFDSFRLEEDWDSMTAALLPNLGMLQGIEMVNNFDPLIPGPYQSWMEEINQDMPGQAVLQMMNISGLIEYAEEGLVAIRSITSSPGPLFLAGCEGIQRPDKITPAVILDSGEDFLENLLIISEDEIECSPGSSGTIETLEQKNGSLVLRVDLDQNGWIFWSQTWYPGWIYKIDGVKVGPTYRANYLFQAVPVPESAREVELIYRPQSVVWGGVISGISLLAALIVRGRKKSLGARV